MLTVARLRTGAGTKNLGLFDDLAIAANVRAAAERELGFHPNHGRAA